MIEEEATVAEVDDGAVWVVKNRSSGCSACSEACPSSIASGFFAAKQVRLRVASNFQLHPGDKVLLGIADDSLVRVSFGFYLLPLLGFFSGALTGEYLFETDLAGVLGGTLGLSLCFVGIKSFRLFDRENCQPVILRKIN